MKLKKWSLLAFWLIVFVAIGLRFFALGEIPTGVNRDEAAIGYTAYSLLQTGKDEYGRAFPVSFESFGDWKLPVYIYETMLTVSIFGLNDFAVRLPSAIAGVISVILTFFLVRELFGKTSLALGTMFLVAISPWSLHLSRVASEANTSMCLVLGAMLLILKGIRKKNWYIIIGAFLLALSFATYASSYVFTPLLALGVFIIYRKELLKNKFTIFAALLFVFLSGFLWMQTTSANTVKLSGTGIFGNPLVVKQQIDEPRFVHANQNVFSWGLHNKITFAAERFLENYLNAFSPDFLFIKGGTNHSHNIENFGNMYMIESLFFLLGIAFLIMHKKEKSHYLILFWLLIGPVAASLTKDAPHTVRTFAIFPIPLLITAFGFMWAFSLVTKKKKYITIAVVSLLFAINIAIYFDRYFVHFPHDETKHWGLAYKQLVTTLSEDKFKNKKVIMSNITDSPYIFSLFYSKFDPKQYQEKAVRYPMTDEGFVHVKNYDKYTYREIDWETDIKLKDSVLIVKSANVPPSVKERYAYKEIVAPSGESIFTLVLP